jgi:hypothetical protein
MSAAGLGVCGVGAAVGLLNLVTMRRLWASPLFERSQKIAQSVLLWLVPGSFVLVRHVLGDHRVGFSGDSVDATAHNPGESGVGDSIATHHSWDSGGGFNDGGGGGGGIGGAD